MADCAHAVILAAILLSFGFSFFTKDTTNPFLSHSVASFIFLTAVFAWVSASNINIFSCPLTSVALFYYEFFASLFIMEVSLRLFWRPLETLLTTTLPPLLEKLLLPDGGGCAMQGFFCPGHTLIFSVLVHLMAINILWCVLFGFGVVQEAILKL